jgi:isocitrate/isopropylmalate dehydrogenase
MLLEHLGLGAEAARLEAAVDRVYAEGKALTPDQGGSARTEAFCEALLTALEA